MIAWLVLLQASLTIAVAGPATSPEYLPLHVAQAENLFAAQKLSVTLRPYRSAPSAAEALATGHAQLAATSLDSALRIGAVEGRPPRLVWGLTAAPPAALLVNPSRKDTIRSPADLVGQTVAVPAPGTPEDQALAVLLARAGVAPQRVLLRSLGERGAARALEAGQVPAAVLGEPYGDVLEKGDFRLEFDGGAFAIHCHERRFPVAVRTYTKLLGHGLDDLERQLGPAAPPLAELQSILTALSNLPDASQTETGKVAELQRETEV